MRPIITTLAVLTLSIGSFAQTISQVLLAPNPIRECDQVNMTMIGSFPNGSYMAQSFTANVNGSVITFQLLATGTGTTGNPAGFSETVPPVGPWPVGTYTFNAELLLNGSTTPSATWTTTVTVQPGPVPDPGQDTFIDICNTAMPFNLTGALDGSPDTWGQWLDPNGIAHANTFVPGTDPGGVYIYSFQQGGPCVDTLSQLFISYTPNASAGANSTALVCNVAPPVDLFPLIQPSPVGPTVAGGTWTYPSGAPFTGIFDPASDPTGNYKYTVTGQAPCGNPIATITVSLRGPGNPGVGSLIQVCSNDTMTNLFQVLTGNPDTTGTWYDPVGFPMPNAWRAAFNALTDFPGEYLYVVNLPPCGLDTAIVEVQVVASSPPCAVGIDEVDTNVDRFEIMPNPANSKLDVFLTLKNTVKDQHLQLLTVTGIVVEDRTVTMNEQRQGHLTMDVSDLNNGTYLLRMYSESGSVVRKLVKY